MANYRNFINSDTLQGLQNLGQFYQSTCTGYAQAWWDQLAPCNYTSADSAIIMPRLIKVCELGSDANHILGSSSISPDSSYRFTSFEDVIKQYNDSAYNGQKIINQCNSYLITRPLPYNQSQLLVNNPLWTKPDSCECSKITNYYNLYSQVAASYINFSDYIQQNLGTTMTEGALDSLRNLCNGTISCTYIPNPINLPPALQCGVSNVCASCLMVQQWNDSFMVKFPGQVPTLLEPDSIQRNTNALFASYMNYQSGFSYSAQDYLTFMDTCSGIVTDTANCSSLIWTVYNPGTGLNINNDLFNAANNNILPSGQFFSNSIFNGPIATQASDYVLVNKKDSIHTTDSIVIMQWRVKPASISDMVNPVVQTGNNSYVGAQWSRDPADTTWLIGTTRIRVIGGILKGIGLQSNSYGMLTDWVKVISGSTSSVLFFDDFLQSSNCSLAAATGSMLCGKSQALDSTFTNVQTSPCADTTAFAISTATQIYNAYKDSLSDYFNEAYTSKCLNAINLESFTVTHAVSEYHYTLYYYDQAGNLIKTVPPEGVHPNRDPAWLAQVEAAKASGTVLVPAHTLPTVYRYNSLNQVVSQNTPDAGISSFWYDKLGRLAISQNAKQALTPPSGVGGLYSYTLYDYIGRITEVGQKLQPTAMNNTISRSPSSLASWLNFNNGTFDYNAVQVTSTVYDIMSNVTQLTAPVVTANPVTFTQQPYTLRNRVSYTQYYDVLQNNSSVVNGSTIYTPVYSNYTTGTYYAYDIHGNVDTLLQDYRLGTMASHGYNRFKEIAYNYDLISGKVNEVDYQPGAIDQFYHRYEYDAENRITDVYTSDNKAYVGHKNLEEHEAFYEYYKHGPLARSVISQQQVQGLDYAYTLEGWLKGMNSTSLQPANDMGNDGLTGSANQYVARDAYGFNLNYFTGEYSSINSGVLPFPGHTGYMSSTDYKPLYNGNISSMAVNIGQLNQPLLYNYQYDQLNRIVSMDAFNGLNQTGNNWIGLNKINDYQERLTYDANGNVQTGLRNGSSSQLSLENFAYNYDAVDKNKLLNIQNSVNSQTYNYSYNAIGETTKDDLAGNTLMEWNVYGKLTHAVKTNGTDITFTYDASGNRITKSVSGANGYTEWYVNDASGNIMAVYKNLNGSDILNLSEQDIYGSSRLAVFYRGINADAALPAGSNANLIGKYYVSGFTRGNKNYYFGNHLGNTLVITSDRKLQHSSNGTTVDYYNADVVSATDYSPFGVNLMDRSINGNNILFGFNGKWNDFEIGYENYGMRMYSSRDRRFKTGDPLEQEYPELTTYQFASNSPISNIDRDGDESEDATEALKDINEELERERYQNLEPSEDREPPPPRAPQGRVVTKPGLSGMVRAYIEENFNSENALDNLRDILEAPKIDIFNLPKEPMKTPGDQMLDELSKSGNPTDRENAARMKRSAKLTPPNAPKVVAKAQNNSINNSTIKANQVSGGNREQIEEEALSKQFPGATVQRQMYLRNSNGKILKDEVTGEARRIDFVVIRKGKALTSVETTSMTSNKTAQTRKENRIRAAGGTFVRDRTTRKLVDVSKIKTIISRRQ